MAYHDRYAVYDDWSQYRSVDDFQFPRHIHGYCESPNGRLIALGWKSSFTFRRQPSERPEAASLLLIDKETGTPVWNYNLPGKPLALSDRGELLFVPLDKKGRRTVCLLDPEDSKPRSIRTRDVPAAAFPIAAPDFIVTCATDQQERKNYLLDAGQGTFRELPFQGVRDAIPIPGEGGVLALASGRIVGIDATGKEKWAARARGPASLFSLPGNSFLACTTACVTRISWPGRRVWRCSLAKAVGGQAFLPEPSTCPELFSQHVARKIRELGLLPDHGKAAISIKAAPGESFALPLSPGTFQQVVLSWFVTLRASLELSGRLSTWEWPSAGSRAAVGALLLPPSGSDAKAHLRVTRGRLLGLEVRHWRSGAPNLARSSEPAMSGENPGGTMDVRLFQYNPLYARDYRGVRPREARTRWRPVHVTPRVLADGNWGKKVLPDGRVPWWYEVRFKMPRTVSALLVVEDIAASHSWAREGFVSAKEHGTAEWVVLFRFRGKACGRALFFTPVKVDTIRYTVTRGGYGCTEIMAFGPEETTVMDEMAPP